MTYEKIPAEQFEFVQENDKLHDQKLQTKARGFFADAMLRFRKNKSSVIAFCILVFLILYAIVVPILSPYTADDKDPMYVSYPPFNPTLAQYGILNGAKTFDSQNDTAMAIWKGVGIETGKEPVTRILGTHETTVKQRGQMVTRYTYDIEVNAYNAMGILYRNFNYQDFQKLQDWQNETGIQVIYPWVDPEDINGISDNPNIWYQMNSDGSPKLDADGNYIHAYSTREDKAGAPYTSIRLAGDPGNWDYSTAKSGSVQCLILYYNYYI